MRALTIWQPWVSLLACGAKKYETRNWATTYRGPIAIHAAAISIQRVLKKVFPLGEWSYAPNFQEKREFLSAVGKAFEDYTPIKDVVEYIEELPFAAIIATAELVECYKILGNCTTPAQSNQKLITVEVKGRVCDIQIAPDEFLLGNWEPGRYAWELAHMTRLQKQIPIKGKQGLWDWKGTKENNKQGTIL